MGYFSTSTPKKSTTPCIYMGRTWKIICPIPCEWLLALVHKSQMAGSSPVSTSGIILLCVGPEGEIRRPRPTQGGARQGIRHFPPTIWKLATATATATAAAAVLFCAMVFSRPGPTFLQQPAAGAAGRQQQSSQQSRSR